MKQAKKIKAEKVARKTRRVASVSKTPAPKPAVVAATVKAVRVVTFEGRRVVRVLDGGHTKTHFHCQMDGGVTMHVPKTRFN